MDKLELKQKDVHWDTFDNFDGSASLRQHGFIAEYPGEEKKGNISLCGKIKGYNENGYFEDISNIGGEKMKDSCCKLCKRIYSTLNT